MALTQKDLIDGFVKWGWESGVSGKLIISGPTIFTLDSGVRGYIPVVTKSADLYVVNSETESMLSYYVDMVKESLTEEGKLFVFIQFHFQRWISDRIYPDSKDLAKELEYKQEHKGLMVSELERLKQRNEEVIQDNGEGSSYLEPKIREQEKYVENITKTVKGLQALQDLVDLNYTSYLMESLLKVPQTLDKVVKGEKDLTTHSLTQLLQSRDELKGKLGDIDKYLDVLLQIKPV